MVCANQHTAPRWLDREHAFVPPNLSPEARRDRELCLHAALRPDETGGGLVVGRLIAIERELRKPDRDVGRS